MSVATARRHLCLNPQETNRAIVAQNEETRSEQSRKERHQQDVAPLGRPLVFFGVVARAPIPVADTTPPISIPNATPPHCPSVSPAQDVVHAAERDCKVVIVEERVAGDAQQSVRQERVSVVPRPPEELGAQQLHRQRE